MRDRASETAAVLAALDISSSSAEKLTASPDTQLAIAALLCSDRRPRCWTTSPRIGYGSRGGPSKRALFDAFDLRVVYAKASDRLSINATLTDAVAKVLRDGLEPRLLQKILRGWDSNPQPIG